MANPIVKVSAKEAISFGWTATNRQLWLLMGMVLFMIAVSYAPNLVGFNLDQFDGSALPTDMGKFGLTVIVFVAVQLINLLLGLGFMKAALKAADGQTVEFTDLFGQAKVMISYIGGAILIGLVMVASFVAPFAIGFGVISIGQDDLNPIVIGSIIALLAVLTVGVVTFLNIRWALFPYIIIDQGLGPIKALKLSWAKTEGNALRLLGFFLLSILVGLLGILALGVGYLVAMPVVTIAMAHIYRQLIA